MHHSQIKSEVRKLIADGTVLPAHPLALDANRKLDRIHQRALTRYYIDAGSGGLAVGVHTTQFAIRDTGLYQPVLDSHDGRVFGYEALVRGPSNSPLHAPLRELDLMRDASKHKLGTYGADQGDFAAAGLSLPKT